ncbi:MAG: transporter substrate-binding domain-containing protein [Gammaproteobacteria bacterium]|nr:transporter substrate-binding domain-containing protein [Gammaproteobacteria bacterium]
MIFIKALKNLKSFNLILILLFNLPQTVSAANYTIGVEKLDYLPYYSIKNKQYIGFARDLFDQFAKDKNHTITYQPLPVSRLIHALINKTIDAKFPDNPNWKKNLKQNHNILYTQPVVSYTDGIMVTANNLQLDSHQFKKIGTIRGFTPWVLLDDVNNGKIQLFEQNNIHSLINKTLVGRLDGSFINIATAKYFLKYSQHSSNALVFNPKLKKTTDYYYLSSAKQPQLIEEFNLWLQFNSEFHQSLLKKWDL